MKKMTISTPARIPSVWTRRTYPVTPALPEDLAQRTAIVTRYYRRSGAMATVTGIGLGAGGFAGAMASMVTMVHHHPAIAFLGMLGGVAISMTGFLRATPDGHHREVPATPKEERDATELVSSLERLVVAIRSRREEDVPGAFREAVLHACSLAGDVRPGDFRNGDYSNGDTRRHWHQDDADETRHVELLQVGRLYHLLGADGHLTEPARRTILKIAVSPLRQIGLGRSYDVSALDVDAVETAPRAENYGWAAVLDEPGSRALVRIQQVERMLTENPGRFADADRNQLRTLFDRHLPELGASLVDAWREATAQERPDLVREFGATLELVRASVDAIEDHARPARQRLQDAQRFLAYRHASEEI